MGLRGLQAANMSPPPHPDHQIPRMPILAIIIIIIIVLMGRRDLVQNVWKATTTVSIGLLRKAEREKKSDATMIMVDLVLRMTALLPTVAHPIPRERTIMVAIATVGIVKPGRLIPIPTTTDWILCW